MFYFYFITSSVGLFLDIFSSAVGEPDNAHVLVIILLFFYTTKPNSGEVVFVLKYSWFLMFDITIFSLFFTTFACF